MRIVSYIDARHFLKSVLDAVERDADITILTRRDGGDAVVMSIAQYQRMAEALRQVGSRWPSRVSVQSGQRDLLRFGKVCRCLPIAPSLIARRRAAWRWGCCIGKSVD